jgi:hypothetical protein
VVAEFAYSKMFSSFLCAKDFIQFVLEHEEKFLVFAHHTKVMVSNTGFWTTLSESNRCRAGHAGRFLFTEELLIVVSVKDLMQMMLEHEEKFLVFLRHIKVMVSETVCFFDRLFLCDAHFVSMQSAVMEFAFTF